MTVSAHQAEPGMVRGGNPRTPRVAGEAGGTRSCAPRLDGDWSGEAGRWPAWASAHPRAMEAGARKGVDEPGNSLGFVAREPSHRTGTPGPDAAATKYFCAPTSHS